MYLACSQQSDGRFAQNFWIDGTPYRQGIQFDEVAFPFSWLGTMWKKNTLRDFNPYPMIHSAGAYLIQHGQPHSRRDGKRTADFTIYVGGQYCGPGLCCRFSAGAKGNQEGADFLTVGSMAARVVL